MLGLELQPLVQPAASRYTDYAIPALAQYTYATYLQTVHVMWEVTKPILLVADILRPPSYCNQRFESRYWQGYFTVLYLTVLGRGLQEESRSYKH
jgi:hypothetical protein